MTCVLPMRKILSIIWKPALKKKKRISSTLVDCLEVSKMKNVTSLCQPWLRVVLGLALIYSLYVLIYKIPLQTGEEVDKGDIEVIRYVKLMGLMAPANPAPRWAPQPKPCRMEFNDDDYYTLRPKANKLDFMNRKNIKAGGYYKPRNCEPRSKVAIIVPYRDRETNLLVFLYNIHPFLVKQMLQYRIFVIEQSGHEKFNKGRLFNAGFDQVARFGKWDCLVFHDVDLLPRSAKTSYSCPIIPTQMSTSVIRRNKTYPVKSNFGGVTSMSIKHFRAVNGYSNLYWGPMGADFTNMFWRLRAARLPIQKFENLMGRYTMLPNPTEINTTRHKRFSTEETQKRYKLDGLSNSNYKTISIKMRSLYTHIVVDINPNKDFIE